MLLESRCSKLTLSSDSKLFNDTYFQTTFAGFFINNIVDPVVVFALRLSTSFDSSTDINIPFDIVSVDTHDGWMRSAHAYIIQVPGVFVISYSFAVSAYQNALIQLKITQSNVVELHIYRTSCME